MRGEGRAGKGRKEQKPIGEGQRAKRNLGGQKVNTHTKPGAPVTKGEVRRIHSLKKEEEKVILFFMQAKTGKGEGGA